MDQLYDIPDFTGYKADKKGNIYSVIPKGCRNRFDKTKWIAPKKIKTKKNEDRLLQSLYEERFY